jgi:Carbohydrate binding domain
MRIALSTPGRKAVFGVVAVGFATLLAARSATQYLATYFAGGGDLAGVTRAVWFSPRNANYHDLLGHLQFFVEQSPESALRSYQQAAALNPYSSRYWLDQGVVYKLLQDEDAQRRMIEHALVAEPTNPHIAWEAAALYEMRRQNPEALQQLRRVMEGDPSRATDAMELAWQINPDVNSLLSKTIPSQPLIYWNFLDFLNSKGRGDDAFAVWTKLAQMAQPLERPRVFAYVNHLLSTQDVSHAELVWQQAAPLCDLAHHQPSSANLVVNGDFSFEVLNAGFDWRYETGPDVTLSLDPTETHGSERSLLISFSGQPVSDAGVQQWIAVQPNSDYHFSAYSKTQDLQGAGGPRFVLQDAFDGVVDFAGEPLTQAGFWKQTTGVIRTGPNTRLLTVHIERFPERLPIRGKLWISGVRLVPSSPGQSF